MARLPRDREDLVPPDSWDTHHHIFELDKYSLAEGRHFTPSIATREELVAFQKSLGFEHTCIAHGLPLGYDLSSLTDVLSHFNGAMRGIGVINHETITDAKLQELDKAGVRSVRLDFFRYEANESFDKALELIKAVANRVAPFGWSIQVQLKHAEWWDRLYDHVTSLPCPIVSDHFAFLRGVSWHADINDPLTQPGASGILKLLRSGKLWIKVSAPYRVSRSPPEYADLQPLVRAFLQANPDRVLYGSDWPHTQLWENRIGKDPTVTEPFMEIDNETWLKTLKTWMSAEEWHKMMVDSPKALYV
ncbi:hypothetical protein I316_06823 [Kwoniella heveanensis BCC8398]|uniref:Amidohydrolase-related domain-containing protein n=1 Tax=Kwoniella heveanensis BCC8398 TaxID=1296120 RepID=A0A1B9GK90_9TREE|nr:hypothetical protein I316_06823 [Kwoniella heveanensis BCC8398]